VSGRGPRGDGFLVGCREAVGSAAVQLTPGKFENPTPVTNTLILGAAQLVPGSRYLIIQSGHDIHLEQPELVLEAIGDVVLAVRAGDLVPH
jgi:hypothetical protein